MGICHGSGSGSLFSGMEIPNPLIPSGLGSMPPMPGYGSGSFMPWPTAYPHYLTTVNYQDMFSETDGVLIFGGSDRYWIVGCMAGANKDKFVTLDVEFFTAKGPNTTPDFCGCVLNTLGGEETMASLDLVKECYVKAVKEGPAPRSGRSNGRKKLTRAEKKQKRKIQKRGGKKYKRNQAQRNKDTLKYLKRMKEKIPFLNGRHKRDVSDEQFGGELLDEDDFMHEANFLKEEEDDLDDDADYEDTEMIEDEDDYDYEEDDEMSSDWDY